MERFSFIETSKKFKLFMLLEYINTNPKSTQQEIADEINVSKGIINRYLHKQIDIGNIKKNKNKDFVLTIKGKKKLQKLRNDYYKELFKIDEFIKDEKKKYSNLSDQKLKIATIKSLGGLLPYLSTKLYDLTEYPIDLDVHIFKDGEELMKNFIKNDFDIGFLGVVPAFLWKSSGAKIKIEAEINAGGHSILAKNEIESIKKLHDSNVLVPRKNDSVSDNLLKKVSQKYDLNIHRKEFDDFDLNLNSIIDSFDVIDEIDALLLWEPYSTYLLNKYTDISRIYDFTSKDDHYISNVMISNINKNFNNNLSFSLFEELLVNTIKLITEKDNNLIKVLADYFKMEEKIIRKSLNKISFNYEKWEE
ncbi:MAG: hypothetical protein ACOCUD_03780 [Bacillota bacterium]